MLPSGWNRGRKDEAKYCCRYFLGDILARCQKSLEEFKLVEFLASAKLIWHDSSATVQKVQ